MPRSIIIDTDTAADDCFALLIGLLDPRADLKAVTIVAGNVGFEQQVHNALLTIGLAGRLGEIPVHRGADRPLIKPWRSASEVHGDGVGGLRRTATDDTVSDEHAVDALVRLAAAQPGEIWVVAIGPLTNIALAVRKDPAFAANLGGLVIMGGSINGRGNITPVAEYNIYVDPEAAQIVAEAGIADVQVVSWDPLTLRQGVFDDTDVAAVGALGTALSRFFVRANQATFDFDKTVGIAGSTHPDSLSVLVAIDPDVVTERQRYAMAIEVASELTRGTTVFSTQGEPNVTAIMAIDRERFVTALHTVLSAEINGAIQVDGI